MSGGASIWSNTAAWVEAIGAIAAVIGSGWVAASGSRATLRREERAEAAAMLMRAQGVLANKTAAFNLAILASTQIHDLHVLLVDEAWRGRVSRISASRALLATGRMLTSFPIQSLNDAPAMVEFSRFPASLAIAAEIYSNLETAVRAAQEAERAAIFDASNEQMARLDSAAQRQLSAFKKALGLDTVITVDTSHDIDLLAEWLHASDISIPDHTTALHLARKAAEMQLEGAVPTRPAIAKKDIGPDSREVENALLGGDGVCPLRLHSCPFYGVAKLASDGGQDGVIGPAGLMDGAASSPVLR